MRGFRLILAVGVATTLLCTRSTSPTQSASAETQSINALDALAPTSAWQTTSLQVAQRTLANAEPSRSKPRRTRPTKRTSSRPKSISQRTRQVGKVARTRATTRLKNNKARAKQRIRRRTVVVRRQPGVTPKRPPLVRVNKPKRAPVRKTATKPNPVAPQSKKSEATGK